MRNYLGGALALAAASLVLSVVACGSDDDSSQPAVTAGADASTTPQAVSCAASETKCGTSCVDTKKNRENCGACGKACAAGEVCAAGTCALSCPADETKCGTTCVDTKLDPANCGACGTACAAGQVCSEGACGLVCVGGTTKCSDRCVDTKVDEANCGTCGTTCAAGQACTGGKCCAPGQSTCNNTCVDLARAQTNCGACGTTCNGTQACIAGSCMTVPTSCKAIKTAKATAPSGIYTIAINGTNTPVWCDMTTDGGGWTMAFKVSSGVIGNANLLWAGGALNDTNEALLAPAQRATDHYVSGIIGLWNAGFAVAEARAHVYQGGSLQKFLKFGTLEASTAANWFARPNLTDSSWTDIPVTPADARFFSITGDDVAGLVHRHFFVHSSYGGCGIDSGWLALIGGPSLPCGWDWAAGPSIGIAYAKEDTKVTYEPSIANNDGKVGFGDTFAVFVR